VGPIDRTLHVLDDTTDDPTPPDLETCGHTPESHTAQRHLINQLSSESGLKRTHHMKKIKDDFLYYVNYEILDT
jgi:hypothetical protein